MEHMATISALVGLLQREVDMSALDTTASLLALQRWQKLYRKSTALLGLPLRNDTPSHVPLVLVQDAYVLCRMAMAPYGAQGSLLFQLMHTPSPTFASRWSELSSSALRSEVVHVAAIAGIAPVDVVYSSPDASVSMPRHFVFIHHGRREIVVALRGTISVSDAITDLIATCTPFGFGGVAHKGIADSAVAVFENLQNLLATQSEKYPDYGIHVTGHSLGGGTAVLLAIHMHFLRRTRETGLLGITPIRCTAFAPPPVFSPLGALPADVLGSLCSWIHRDDIVPRLSVRAVRDLLQLLHGIHTAHPGWTHKTFSHVDLLPLLMKSPSWLQAILCQSDVSAILDTCHASPQAQPLTPTTPPLTVAVDNASLTATTMAAGAIASGLAPVALPEDTPRLMLPGTLYSIRQPVGTISHPSADALANEYMLKVEAMLTSTVSSISTSVSSWMSGWRGSSVSVTAVVADAESASKAVGDGGEVELHALCHATTDESSGFSPSTSSGAGAMPVPSGVEAVTAEDTLTIAELQGTAVADAIKATSFDDNTAAFDALTSLPPFLTVCEAVELQHLSVSETAISDHLPDVYLQTLRDLVVLATAQSQLQQERK